MVFGLTACGYSLNELYYGDSYNSPNFADNYYKVWDDDINYKGSKNKITNSNPETIVLDKATDYVFTKFGEDNFNLVEPRHDDYVYINDFTEEITGEDLYPYGPNNNLSDINDSFRYGYMSKLFDGQLFCDGDYEKARVQIDTSGFGRTFSKELYSSTYFAISFKTSIEYRRIVDVDGQDVEIDISKWWNGSNVGSLVHDCGINLTINFYLKNAHGYERVPVSYEIADIPSNGSEDPLTRANYILFGFEIGHSVPSLDRCAGISIEYTYTDAYLDNINAQITAKNESNATNAYFNSNESSRHLYGGPIQHSVLLYEVLFPTSIWH